ncbi:RidA family protein [Pyxidicoccus parkwayensis]|uniref:RidA family protein n=1 Tax=Pyxidicoccus parkwayensis TaxID=2813578 RepID=A0ABX7P5G2_9BACT|nr:RidA family protein [Pyxidicoccus parkwaysis]QSQ25683.1 RidA family protein [Pyxidicoccus parkwaysis]
MALCLATGCATSSRMASAAEPPSRPTEISPASPVGRRINPPQLPRPNGYSHVVEVHTGRTVYISGQVPLDAGGNVIGAGDFRAQTEQVFANLSAALSAVGANYGHVVKLTIFVTQLTPETLTALREVRDRHIDAAHGPASSLVEVSRLFRPELLVEMEAVAVIPD